MVLIITQNYTIENEYLNLELTVIKNTLFADYKQLTHFSTLTYHQQIAK